VGGYKDPMEIGQLAKETLNRLDHIAAELTVEKIEYDCQICKDTKVVEVTLGRSDHCPNCSKPKESKSQNKQYWT